MEGYHWQLQLNSDNMMYCVCGVFPCIAILSCVSLRKKIRANIDKQIQSTVHNLFINWLHPGSSWLSFNSRRSARSWGGIFFSRLQSQNWFTINWKGRNIRQYKIKWVFIIKSAGEEARKTGNNENPVKPVPCALKRQVWRLSDFT